MENELRVVLVVYIDSKMYCSVYCNLFVSFAHYLPPTTMATCKLWSPMV